MTPADATVPLISVYVNYQPRLRLREHVPLAEGAPAWGLPDPARLEPPGRRLGRKGSVGAAGNGMRDEEPMKQSCTCTMGPT